MDDFFGDAKSQTEMVFRAAGLVRAVKTPEDFGLFLVGNADAVIYDGDCVGIPVVENSSPRFGMSGAGQGAG